MSESENIEEAVSPEAEEAVAVDESAATVVVPTAAVSTESGEPAEPAAADPAVAKPKRRIRTGTLLTCALVLGVLGGAGTGYAVQYERPATPLPPLNQAQPVYAPVGVYTGVAPAMLPSSQDDATLTDGDLRKLLLPIPSGATATPFMEARFFEPFTEASLCNDQASCLKSDYGDGIDSMVDVGWSRSDGNNVEIRIYRMSAGSSANARGWPGKLDAEFPEGGFQQIDVPTGMTASGLEFTDQYGTYTDEAAAVHGDLVVVFWVSSTKSVPDPSIINSLMTAQIRRL